MLVAEEKRFSEHRVLDPGNPAPEAPPSHVVSRHPPTKVRLMASFDSTFDRTNQKVAYICHITSIICPALSVMLNHVCCCLHSLHYLNNHLYLTLTEICCLQQFVTLGQMLFSRLLRQDCTLYDLNDSLLLFVLPVLWEEDGYMW